MARPCATKGADKGASTGAEKAAVEGAAAGAEDEGKWGGPKIYVGFLGRGFHSSTFQLNLSRF